MIEIFGKMFPFDWDRKRSCSDELKSPAIASAQWDHSIKSGSLCVCVSERQRFLRLHGSDICGQSCRQTLCTFISCQLITQLNLQKKFMMLSAFVQQVGLMSFPQVVQQTLRIQKEVSLVRKPIGPEDRARILLEHQNSLEYLFIILIIFFWLPPKKKSKIHLKIWANWFPWIHPIS